MLSPKKRKTPVQKQLRMKPEKVLFYTISLFLFSSIVTTVYLYFWILFQFCGLILYFFVCVSGWGMLISVLGFVFLFSGSVFLFWVSVLSYVFLFWVGSFLFWLLLLSCGFFVSIGQPIYLIVLCI